MALFTIADLAIYAPDLVLTQPVLDSYVLKIETVMAMVLGRPSIEEYTYRHNHHLPPNCTELNVKVKPLLTVGKVEIRDYNPYPVWTELEIDEYDVEVQFNLITLILENYNRKHVRITYNAGFKEGVTNPEIINRLKTIIAQGLRYFDSPEGKDNITAESLSREITIKYGQATGASPLKKLWFDSMDYLHQFTNLLS